MFMSDSHFPPFIVTVHADSVTVLVGCATVASGGGGFMLMGEPTVEEAEAEGAAVSVGIGGLCVISCESSRAHATTIGSAATVRTNDFAKTLRGM